MSEVWYRINTMGEKNLFTHSELFDGIVIPAHILAFYDPSLANFIKDINLPFIIDPMTYVWNRPRRNVVNSKGVLKKSYQKYVKKLDCKLGSILGIDNIASFNYTPDDLEKFIDRILTFQSIAGQSSVDPRSKSLARIRTRKRKRSGDIAPTSLIPPYFYFRNFNTRTYQLTVESAQIANQTDFASRYDISPLLCMAENIIDSDTRRDRLVTDFSNFKSVIIWVSAFDDRSADVDQLKNVRKIIQAFHEVGIRTSNLFGGSFSVLMSLFGLDTFSSGISLSHKKAVDAIAGGGGMPLRYYDPTMKIEMVNDVAWRFYSEYPELFICECLCCNEMREKLQTTSSRAEREILFDPFFLEIRSEKRAGKTEVIRPAHMNWMRSRLHFMYVRRKEILDNNTSSITEQSSSLLQTYETLSRNIDFIQYNRLNSVEHLRRWSNSIGSP